MSELRKRFVEDLQLRNYARRTIETYTRQVAGFARHFGRSPEELGPEEIRSYQLYLVQEKGVSWSAFNQAVCGLRFLYRVTLPRPWVVQQVPFGKRPKRLPSVLGSEPPRNRPAAAVHAGLPGSVWQASRAASPEGAGQAGALPDLGLGRAHLRVPAVSPPSALLNWSPEGWAGIQSA